MGTLKKLGISLGELIDVLRETIAGTLVSYTDDEELSPTELIDILATAMETISCKASEQPYVNESVAETCAAVAVALRAVLEELAPQAPEPPTDLEEEGMP